MEDLTHINRRIAEYWLGHLDPAQMEYLRHVPVCLGRLTLTAPELRKLLSRSSDEQERTARTIKLNLRYLRFARLAAKDAIAGKPEMLVKLGITLDQAEVLSHMTDHELERLASHCEAPVVHFSKRTFARGSLLRVRAAKHHAAAFLATDRESKQPSET